MDIKLIKEIRTQSGASFGDCKKALTQANGDLQKAIEIASNMLKAQQVAENEEANAQNEDNNDEDDGSEEEEEEEEQYQEFVEISPQGRFKRFDE